MSRRIDWEAIRGILVLILDQLPGDRAGGGGEAVRITPEEIPQAGLSAVEILEAIHRGEIKARRRDSGE